MMEQGQEGRWGSQYLAGRGGLPKLGCQAAGRKAKTKFRAKYLTALSWVNPAMVSAAGCPGPDQHLAFLPGENILHAANCPALGVKNLCAPSLESSRILCPPPKKILGRKPVALDQLKGYC